METGLHGQGLGNFCSHGNVHAGCDAEPKVTPDVNNGPGSATQAKFDSFAAKYEEIHAHNIKLTGEAPEYFAAYKASYIARSLPSAPCRVLDYGCGIGTLSRHLKRRIARIQIDGFDPSEESLAHVDPDLLAQGTFTSDPRSLALSYDLIVMANVLHHVTPAERQKLISEVCTRLAAGGKLVIFEHNPANPLTRWAVAHCAFDGDAILLWPGEVGQYVVRAGLQTQRDYIVFFPRWLSSFRRIEPLLRWCPLGAQYAATGTRAS